MGLNIELNRNEEGNDIFGWNKFFFSVGFEIGLNPLKK
jgi:hypothetical protein